jgi:hypothetical protein
VLGVLTLFITMAPKALKPDIEGFAFHFYSNENKEPMHVHVRKGDGMVKYWLEPVVLADDNGRMKIQEVRRAEELVRANKARIVKAWNEHFKP